MYTFFVENIKFLHQKQYFIKLKERIIRKGEVSKHICPSKQIKFPSAQIERERRASGQRRRARGLKGQKNRSVCRRFTKKRNSCFHYSTAISRWLRLERGLSRLVVASCIAKSSPWRCAISHSWDFLFCLRTVISQSNKVTNTLKARSQKSL